jgi:hypothetical protein
MRARLPPDAVLVVSPQRGQANPGAEVHHAGVEVARFRSTATLAAYGLRRESSSWRALSRGR